MVRLDDLIGKKVTLALVGSEAGSYDVTLHGVESGGLWIESADLEKLLCHRKGYAVGLAPALKPVFFYPYSQIALLIAYTTEL
jgi:hypothetical protein